MTDFVFRPTARRAPPKLVPTEHQKQVLEKAKKEKTPVYNLTWEQIEQLKKDAAKEAIGQVIELTLGLPTMVLMDKYGDVFDRTKLSEFCDHVVDLYESYEMGYLTLQDVRDALWEEGGYKIQKRDIWRRTR
ncbi:MAG: hypothetical protein IKY91_02585 [Akkermansia sp.]|nr:hypothetical protein [Akkermansia sp.]